MIKHKKTLLIWSIALLCPVVSFYLLEWYLRNPFKTMQTPAQILNIIFFELVFFLFFSLSGSLRVSLMTETLLAMLYGLANYFVLSFRSAPIMPWDIYSIKTAASVADNFKYTLSRQALIVLLLFVLLLFVESRLKFRLPKKLWPRIGAAVFCLLLLTGFAKTVQHDSAPVRFRLYDKLFTPTTMVYKDGTAVAFLMELRYLSVEKPFGYQKQEAAKLLASYEEQAKLNAPASNVIRKPNIIVIMNEAFSDLSVLGDFTCNEDYLPFLHKLQKGYENTQTGYLNVSVFGGNTANTEFEFLTGNTMAFLPQGSIPYQQYLKRETPSLASHLKEQGYDTIAMHPYHATGWERDKVYSWFGFDRFYALPDFKDAKQIRKYVSDISCYDLITRLHDDKSDAPFFIFNVTMQNHSSYTDAFANFTPDIQAEDGNSDALDNYLSLMKLSDTAFEELIARAKAWPDDTIIVMFGDHQPTNSVSSPILRLNGKSHDTLTEEESLLKYKVPFVIWANFDIQEAVGVETSPNYLGGRIMELCRLPQTGYQLYLQELSKDYPVITAQTPKQESDDIKEALRNYQALEYYQLFDR